MYELLTVLVFVIMIIFASLKYRETFVVKYGNPFDDEDLISFDAAAPGTRAFGITPDTCPANKPDRDAGLCYEQCDEGYNGVGPVCWAQTENVGIGKVLIPTSCPEMGRPDWTDTGLLCNQPLKWNSCAWRGLFKECWGGLEGGRIIAKSLTCRAYGDSHPDQIDALCYARCPEGMRHVPGMPYLCFKGSRGLSYGRGAGDVPPIFAFGE